MEKKNQQIILNALIKAINFGEKAINVAEGNDKEEGLLLVGFTGTGKSTLAALFFGITFMSHDSEKTGRLVLERSPQSEIQYPEDFIIQHQAQSGTEIPVILKDKSNNFFFVDMPGSNDNKGITQEIINGFYIYRVFQTHKRVKILFVITQSQLFENKAPLFIKSVENISLTLQKVDYKNCIAMVVTNAEPDVTSLNVVNYIREKILKATKLAISPEAKQFCEYITTRADLITVMKRPIVESNNLDHYYQDFQKNQYEVIQKLQAMQEPTIYTSVSDEAKEILLPFIAQVKESYKLATDCFVNDMGNFVGNKLDLKFNFENNYNREENETALQQVQKCKNFFIELEQITVNQNFAKTNVSKNVQKINLIIDKSLQYKQYNIEVQNLALLKNHIIVMEYFKTLDPNTDVDSIVKQIFEKLNTKCKEFKEKYVIMENSILDNLNFCALTQFDKLCKQFQDCEYNKNWKNNSSKFLLFVQSISQQQSFEDVCNQILNKQPKDFQINLTCLHQLREVVQQCNQYLGKDALKSIIDDLKNKLKDSQLQELNLKREKLGEQTEDQVIKKNLKDENNQLQEQLKKFKKQNPLQKLESDKKIIKDQDKQIFDMQKEIQKFKDKDLGCNIF